MLDVQFGRSRTWLLFVIVVCALVGCGGRSDEDSGIKMETYRDPQGRKTAEGSVRGEVRHGTWTEWDGDGGVVSRGDYVDGVKQGEWLETSYDDAIGEWVRSRGEYRDGTRSGLWQVRAATGWLVREEELRDGALDGVRRTFHRNGKLAEEGRWRGNVAVGRWTTYHEDGSKESEGDKEDGRPRGVWRYWNRDGSPRAEVDHAIGTVPSTPRDQGRLESSP